MLCTGKTLVIRILLDWLRLFYFHHDKTMPYPPLILQRNMNDAFSVTLLVQLCGQILKNKNTNSAYGLLSPLESKSIFYGHNCRGVI